MSQRADLMGLLMKWRELTGCESQAILLGDWTQVATHQAQKALLFEPITQSLEPSAAKAPSPSEEPQAVGFDCRGVVNEILALESKNNEVLSARRLRNRAELAGITETSRSLHNVRRAYGAVEHSAWQSYS